ncbi:Protein FAM160B1 [Hondaea fermentalgiana]|uniref:Protein FAM160B1 n=1 Tax=Hondaea fermentalgiana TaxID=2315210 RepID=A0A2R5GT82_9STRA|nr:Protein FAM160B1 [Hondaea fermentalgiana]|eukprot:GBG31863.1 Protein FAM160B1 [Hondaea fermentalgiana]
MFAKLRKGVKDFAQKVAAPAESRPAVEVFKDLWDEVTEEHARVLQANYDLDDPGLLLKTSIPANLDAMVTLLVREDLGLIRDSNRGVMQDESSSPSDDLGGQHIGPLRACLEYTLENRVFIDLCAKGLADRPNGMMPLILITLTRLFDKLRHPLLPYKTAHAPLCQLIRVSAEVGAPDAQERLVSLLRTLWLKMRADPSQLQFFYAPGKQGSLKLELFDALLPHIAADNDTGERARYAMLCVSSIFDPMLHKYIVDQTLFCKRVAQSLLQAFQSAVDARRAQNSSQGSLQGAQASSSPGAAHLDILYKPDLVQEADRVLAMRWKFALALSTPGVFTSIDLNASHDEDSVGGEMTDDDNDDVGEGSDLNLNGKSSTMKSMKADAEEDEAVELLPRALVREITESFLTGPLRAALLETHEEMARDAMLAVCVLLESAAESGSGTARHGPLQWNLVSMLISPALEPDMRTLDQENDKLEQADAQETARLQTELLVRIDSMSPQVSMAALKLFSALLDLNDARILHSLVLRQLYGGLHLEGAPEGTVPPLDPLRTPPRKPTKLSRRVRTASAGNAVDFLDKYPGSPKPPVISSERKLKAISNQERKDLVTFETYLTDEQTCAAARLAAYTSPVCSEHARSCSPQKKSKRAAAASAAEAPSKERDSGQTTGKAAFVEGLFLSVVLNKLERMLDSSLEENLLLTGILAKLAQCPHRVMHSYLYDEAISLRDFRAAFEGRPYTLSAFDAEQGDTLLKIKEGVRTLANVLSSVWKEALERAQDFGADFEAQHTFTRSQLGADGDLDFGDEGLDASSVSAALADFGPSKKRFVQAYVVIEEFFKELASVLQAKQNLALLQHDLQ